MRRSTRDEYAMSMSTPKRRKDSHRVSDSDDGDADSDGETSSVGGFGDPNAFLNKFGGYASDGSESEPDQDTEDDDEKEDGEFSDSDEDRRSVKRKKPKKDEPRSRAIDFSSLPVIDNNGLGFLPTMQYFPIDVDCPLKPINKLKPEQSVTVLIHLPGGGFSCVALPLEALEEDENDDYKLRIIREKVYLVSEVLDQARVEASASGLGLEGFRKLLSGSKKDREQDDSDDDGKPKPPPEAGFSATKKRKRRDFETKARVIKQILADDPDDQSIEAQLARAEKIKTVAKKKKYKVPKHEVQFIQNLFLPPIHKWDPAYKSAVTSLPIPHNSWVDGPPELNDYMLHGLRNASKGSGNSFEPQTRWDHLLVDWQRTTVHMASGLTPWLALELPENPDEITAEMLDAWKKKQQLARLAATGCNVLYEELGLRRRMNFFYEFKKSSEWKNLGFLKTVRMGKEILKKDVSKAFNEVKAVSKAHDKQVSLNTNYNYNSLQASKPWASPEEVAAFNRGRGAQGRGRGAPMRGGKPGNDFFPRNNAFSPGGSNYNSAPRQNNGGKGNFNQGQKFQRGNQQQGFQRNNNNSSNNAQNNPGQANKFNNGGFPSKPRPPNKGFRGGGN